MTQKKEKRVWQSWDLFPFGKYKGVLLSRLAEIDLQYLLWWQQNRSILFSDQLKAIIQTQKLLGL